MAINKNGLIDDEMSEQIVEAAEQMAMTYGAHTVNVRKILISIGITNRVFYNRFRNVEDVLDLVYRRKISKIREEVAWECDDEEQFFEGITNMVTNILLTSYDVKMQFNQYVFENDSRSKENYEWWMAEIEKIFAYAKEQHYIKEDLDCDILSYSLWCFCRGYNADAVGRKLPKEEAARRFRYSFGIILDGLRKKA